MRILLAGHQATLGGAQNIMLSQLAWLHAAGHTMTAAFPEDGPAVEAARAMGVDTVLAPMDCWMFLNPRVPEALSHTHYLDGFARRVDAFIDVLDDVRPELVMCNTSVILEPVLAACRRRVPWLWYVHEIAATDPFLRDSGVPGLAAACMALPGGVVVAVSDAVSQSLQGAVAAGRLHTVRNGVEAPAANAPAPALACPTGRVPLLFAGNLVRRKGIDVLIDAFSEVLNRRDDVHLFVAGNEYEFTREALLARLAPQHRDHVTFLGFREDIARLMAQAAVVLVPSLGDPFPLCVLEAMAAGSAVVGTHSGGMDEQILDGVTGRLVTPGDAAVFAEAICDVIAEPARHRAMGEAGYARWAAEFTRERMCREFAEVVAEAPARACWDGHARATSVIDLCLRLSAARGAEGEWLQAQFERLSAVEQEYRNLLDSLPMRLLRPLARLARRFGVAVSGGPALHG